MEMQDLCSKKPLATLEIKTDEMSQGKRRQNREIYSRNYKRNLTRSIRGKQSSLHFLAKL